MKKIIIVSVLITLMFACRKEIDIKVPDSERKIVLNAMIFPDSVFTANVFRSNHVQDNLMQLLYLNNATVNVYEAGNLIDVLPLDTAGYYRGSAVTAEQGHEYTIEAVVPNLKTVESTTKMMEKVPVLSVDSLGLTTFDNGQYYEVDTVKQYYTLYRVNFKDNPDTEDFYRIKIESEATEPYDTTAYDPYLNQYYTYTVYPPQPYVETNDPAIDISPDRDAYYYLSDKLFNGETYGFEFGVMVPDDYKGHKLYINVEHISPDFYHYIISLNFQHQTNGLELFFQTVEVYNNIENGFGILGTATVSRDSVIVY